MRELNSVAASVAAKWAHGTDLPSVLASWACRALISFFFAKLPGFNFIYCFFLKAIAHLTFY
jgi:hypothetical protein